MQTPFHSIALALMPALALICCFPAANAADSEQRLPEVKVRADTENVSSVIPAVAGTATKTDTPLSEIPQSIQVVPPQVIKDQAAYSVDASIRNVSGIAQSSTSNYGFFNNYLVRGLNANFLRDGVPDGLTINGYARTLADVESIEVLKGPGSALYGSGAPGGTINLITRKPRPEPQVVLEATIGSFDTHRLLLDATGPLGNMPAAGRIVTDYARSAGYRGLSSEYGEALPSLQWRPNANHTVRVNIDYRDLKSTSDTVGIPFHASTIATLSSPTLVGIARDAKLYTPFATVTQTISRASVNHEMNLTPNATIRQNFVYLNRNLDLLRNAATANFTSATTLANRTLRDQSDDAAELIYQLEPMWKLGLGTTRHTLLTGVEYHRTEIDTRRSQSNLAPIENVFAPVIPEQSRQALLFAPHFDRKLKANQFGVYVQDQVKLSERWQARIGARWDRFRIDDSGSYNTLFDAGGAFSTTLAANGQSFLPKTPTQRFESAARTDDRLSGQAGVVYQLSPITSFYAGAARSHQAIVSTEAARSAFAPESAVQYEIGNRTYLLDDRLYFNTALFEVTRSDFLQTINGVPTPVGEQRTRGVEMDVAAELARGWRLTANYAYQDAAYTRLKTAAGTDDPATGKAVVGVPRNSAALWMRYDLQAESLRGWGVGGGVQLKDAVFIDQNNTQRIPGYLIADLALFYAEKRYELQVNLTNVGNTNWYRNGVNTAALPGDPRAVYATIRIKL